MTTGHVIADATAAHRARSPEPQAKVQRSRAAASGSVYPRSALITAPDLASLLSVVLALARPMPVARAISLAVLGPVWSASRTFARV